MTHWLSFSDRTLRFKLELFESFLGYYKLGITVLDDDAYGKDTHIISENLLSSEVNNIHTPEAHTCVFVIITITNGSCSFN